MLTFTLNTLDELSAFSLFYILKARCDVFVVEQNCAYPEIDDIDLVCWHLQGLDSNQLACYARIIPPKHHATGFAAIGRVLTTKDYRGNAYGRALMQTAIDICQQNYPSQPIFIAAQTYLSEFYQSFGFIAQGDSYFEDGIEHINMILDTQDDQ